MAYISTIYDNSLICHIYAMQFNVNVWSGWVSVCACVLNVYVFVFTMAQNGKLVDILASALEEIEEAVADSALPRIQELDKMSRKFLHEHEGSLASQVETPSR